MNDEQDNDEQDNVDTASDHVVTIMIAVDESDASVDAVRTAHRLFGDGARYFVVNVGARVGSSMGWASVYPVMTPIAWYPPVSTVDPLGEGATVSARAEERAADIAASASLDDAVALGEVGDPATAIISAAHDHRVDVVVIASHERTWLTRLFAGSVERDLLREADFAVLVIK